MVDTPPPAKPPFRNLEEVERELDWQENQLRRPDGFKTDLALLAALATGTVLMVALILLIFGCASTSAAE